ncbi:hypothetical protein COT98_01855, partial [Candidatus Falkowbacteria bacterium CG10_big_fil_rev_8_21_14_0_10_39_9]
MGYKKSIKAFTLVEMLIVIAIIGVLMGVMTVSYSAIRQRARDTKRVKNIEQIQTALKLYFYNESSYPDNLTFDQALTGSTSSTTYMQIIPSAPTPTDGNCTSRQNAGGYTANIASSSYQVAFCLGNRVGNLSAGPKCLTPSGIIDMDCTPFACGDQLNITIIGNHVCNTSAPDYDTCSYSTVQIGTQCWTKQNLNIGSIVSGATTQANNDILEKYCYNDNTDNCLTDGGLYKQDEAMQYSAAKGTQGICPSGWHLPSDAEQNTLDQYLNDTTCDANRVNARDCANAGTKLKAGGSSGFEGLL